MCDNKLSYRGVDQPKENRDNTAASVSRSNTSIFSGIQIHDESDKTKEVAATLPLKLVEKEGDRAAIIADRQMEVLSNLNVPGLDRYQMPAIATKSKRLRDAENPSFYPFCTLPIADAERMLMLKQLQQLVKSNFIDRGVSSDKRHSNFKVFDRSFQNHMTPEIFR